MTETKLRAVPEGGSTTQGSVQSSSSFTSTVVGRIDQAVRRPGDTPKDRKIRVNTFLVGVSIGGMGGLFAVMLALAPMVWTVALMAGGLPVVSSITCSALWWGNVSPNFIAHFMLVADMMLFGSVHWVGGSWVGSFEAAYTVFVVGQPLSLTKQKSLPGTLSCRRSSTSL